MLAWKKLRVLYKTEEQRTLIVNGTYYTLTHLNYPGESKLGSTVTENVEGYGMVKPSSKKNQEDKASLLKLYEDMLLVRRFEEKAGQLYGMGLIAGFCHLYIGQEAIVVGIQHALNQGDQMISGYRIHGHAIASGMDPKAVMAELLGRKDGCSKGKGGSMHMFDIKNHFYGGHGIVGGQVSLGTGIAFANQYRKTKNVCVTYFGDGAANQGQVYESFNMAALWKLPVLYIIENNHYAMGTSVERASSETQLYKRGLSFGIPGEQVDGMDVLAVKTKITEVLKDIRAGKGPRLLEMLTYRYRGHSMSDPAKYRSKEEVTEVKEHRDPINQFKTYLQKTSNITDDEISHIEKNIKININDVIEFSKQSPEPDETELYTDVYVSEGAL